MKYLCSPILGNAVSLMLAMSFGLGASADEIPPCGILKDTRLEYPTQDRSSKLIWMLTRRSGYRIPGWADPVSVRHQSSRGAVLTHKRRTFLHPFKLATEPEQSAGGTPIGVWYPSISAGDVIPLGHCVARYVGREKSRDVETGEQIADMVFRFLPPDFLPEPYRRHASSWVVPIQPPWAPLPHPNNGHLPCGVFDRHQLRVESMDVLPDGTAVARLLVREARNGQVPATRDYRIAVKAGDEIAFYIEGQSLAEMSDSFRSPIGTIKRRLHTARNRLKDVMGDFQPA